jgi:phytoene dehydrogenase-like protein
MQDQYDGIILGAGHNSLILQAYLGQAGFKVLCLEQSAQAGGARYIEPELNVALLLKDGTALEWWTDFDRTVASFARFSPRDARTLVQWRDRFLPVLEKILTPEAQAPKAACCLKPAASRLWNLSSASSNIRRSKPACYSLTACAR